MPNSNHYVLCPYYGGDKNESISCEDVIRTFPNLKKKEWYMKTYCDSEWKKCTYAQVLNSAYEEGEEALEREKIKATEKEIKSLQTRLGIEKKRTERQQKKIDDLMQQKKELYGKWRAVNEELTNINMKIYGQLQQMVQLYEDRMAYLIATKCDGELKEKDVEAWAEGKEFAVTCDYAAKERVWKVITREEKKKDEQLLGSEPKPEE